MALIAVIISMSMMEILASVMITKGIVNFSKRFYLLMSNFGHMNCETKIKFSHQYCCSLFGAPGIEISKDLCEWPIAPEPLREKLCEQLLLSNGPTLFHVHEWLCTQN